MSPRQHPSEANDSRRVPKDLREAEARAASERPVKRLLTERAVFQPRKPAVETPSPFSLDREPLSLPQSAATNESDFGRSTGEYRVPILHLGREELAELFPEDQACIRQLTDLEIEALALEVEGALAEIYAVVLRLVWAKFQIRVQPLR